VCPQGAHAEPSAPQRWGVVVGIGKYQSPKITPLRFARKDAEAIHEFLTNPAGGGIPRENCQLLLDEQATLRNLRTALGTFLTRKAARDDTVVIFYSGHGSNEQDPTGEQPDGLDKYLVPHDGDPDDLYGTGLSMREIPQAVPSGARSACAGCGRVRCRSR
jgi:uncharacterized caspase-like protein